MKRSSFKCDICGEDIPDNEGKPSITINMNGFRNRDDVETFDHICPSCMLIIEKTLGVLQGWGYREDIFNGEY